MLPCPSVVLPDKDEFKIFQHYMYFSSDRAAAGLNIVRFSDSSSLFLFSHSTYVLDIC